MRRHTLFPVLLFLATLMSGCNPPTGDTRERVERLASGQPINPITPRSDPYQIVVIPRESEQSFQQALRQGAEVAASKLNATIVWIPAPSVPAKSAADEILRQKQLIADAIEKKVDGIALAPADATELVIPVNRSAKARIPVAIFDVDVNTKYRLSLIATDDFTAGQMAARHIGKIISGSGTVGLISAQPNPQSAIERERAFTDTIEKEFPQIQLVRSNDGDAERFFAPDSEIAAIFCSEQSVTLSAVQTLRDKKMAGQIPLIGFGFAPMLTDAVKAGELDALVQPNPYQMGYESVKAVVDHLQLRDVARRIDSGMTLAIRENVNTAQNQQSVE